MLIDIHAKSSRSAGTKFSADEIARQAKETGFDGVAFCESLSTAHCREALAACERNGIKGFIGVEIPTQQGIILGFAPTIDEFFLAEEWRQVTEVTTPSAKQVIDMFEALGGATIASRPYDLSIPHNMGDLIFTLEGISAIEVFNTRAKQLQCDFAIEAASYMNVPTCGGSDPTSDDKALARYATFFEGEFETQAEFVAALKAGNSWAVQLGATPRSQRPPRDDDRGDRGGRGGGRGRSGGRDSRGGGGRGGRDSRGGRDGGRGGRRDGGSRSGSRGPRSKDRS